MKPNWLRSLWHVGGGLFAIWLYHWDILGENLPDRMSRFYYSHEQQVAGGICIVLLVMFLLLETWRSVLPKSNPLKKYLERPALKMAKPQEEAGALTSQPHYIVGLALLFLTLPKPYACYGIACLALGDPLACWAGYVSKTWFGRSFLAKSPWSFDRTIGGSLAMFLVCLIVGPYFLGLTWHIPIIAASATASEFYCGRKWFTQDGFLEDNLIIPLGVILATFLVLAVQTLQQQLLV